MTSLTTDTWKVTYKPTAKDKPVDTGLEATTDIEAARAFSAWRVANGVDDYYSVIFERVTGEPTRVTVTPLHEHYSPDHLEEVVREMRRRGPPRIRAYLDTETGAWFAFEGTHRLRAAKHLGVVPILVPVRWPRSRQALLNARHAAVQRGHAFDRVEVAS